MTALDGLLSFARAVPWQAWAVAGLIVAVGIYGCQQRREGEAALRAAISKSNDAARERADEGQRSVENCTGRWDRARGLCVPDGAGR